MGGALVGCGTNIDLGGSADASLDAGACPAFAPPAEDASCKACRHGSSGCQANGCYNGYSCDVSERDCKSPGTACPTGADAEAGLHD
jgi:hypothetical protein